MGECVNSLGNKVKRGAIWSLPKDLWQHDRVQDERQTLKQMGYSSCRSPQRPHALKITLEI